MNELSFVFFSHQNLFFICNRICVRNSSPVSHQSGLLWTDFSYTWQRVTSHVRYCVSFHWLIDRFVKRLFRLTNKETSKALHYWWGMDSQAKGAVMQILGPCHDVTIAPTGASHQEARYCFTGAFLGTWLSRVRILPPCVVHYNDA